MIDYFKKNISLDFLNILTIFLLWRILLIVFLIIGLLYLPLGYKDRFLGGGLKNYSIAPEVFSWANFDGEHYLSISIVGYKGLEQAFFPVYPKIINFLTKPFSTDFFQTLLASTIIGIIISHLFFLLGLVLLWELVKMDFSSKISYWTICSLTLFPTSFYFGAVYSEALFFFLVVSSFYFARKKQWFWAGFIGAVASATRIFGIILLPAFLIEVYQQKVSSSRIFWLLLIPSGLLIYMYYQWITIGDPLAFYHLQKIVGEQHQSGLTSLPQVYYRYYKILLNTTITNPIYQTIVLELLTGVVFFILPIYGFFKKIRLSYVFFALISFLLPTIQGSFSSVPRYVLVFFPSFIALGMIVSKWPKFIKIIYILTSTLVLAVEVMLFLRGYWVA